MRELNTKEVLAVSGANIDVSTLIGLWSTAMEDFGSKFYGFASGKINALGFASATTESSQWMGSEMGAAGWFVNDNGQTVTWFNNGIGMAFQYS